jgi:CheY-like chemotaxis protein/HPt (histidine-containing phosphotransfer) domain-containing protein
VDVASNGREAVDMARKFAYDLILMDAQMPEMDGFAATRAIRALDGPAGQVPIVAMTALALAGDRERCLAAGMDDYLSKPIDPQELAQAVARQLAGRQAQAHTPAPASTGPAQAAPIASSLPTLDLPDLLGRVEGDREILREIAQAFLQEAPDRLQKLGQALAAGDLQAMSQESHSLKGELANLSAKAASHLAREMEMAAKQGQSQRLAEVWPALQEEFQLFLKALTRIIQ